jgi:hypothetical protein
MYERFIERKRGSEQSERIAIPEMMPLTVFSSHGLEVSIFKTYSELSMTPDNNGLVIPPETVIGRMRFVPFKDGMKISRAHAIMAGTHGFDNLLHYFKDIREGNMPGRTEVPKYLIGSTNEHMAKFAKNIGFTIAEVEPDQHYYSVWGEPETVESRFKEFMESKSRASLEKISKRAIADNPEYWEHTRNEVDIIEAMIPHPEAVFRHLQQLVERDRQITHNRRTLDRIRGIIYGLSVLNLGFGAARIAEGDYVSAGMSCTAGIVPLALDQYRRRRGRM